MTTYEITVNGKSYDVTVQKKQATATTSVNESKIATAVNTPVTSIPKVIVPTPSGMGTSAVGSGDKKVSAPMPGKIMAIKVNVGDSVQKGQEMIIMEAMKMHNPILAAHDGVVTEILVKVNDPVQSGQLLLSIR